MNRIVFFCLFFFTLVNFTFCEHALSWNGRVTHEDLSEYAANSSVLKACINGESENCGYLNKLGMENGLKEALEWSKKKKQALKWLLEGGELEDEGWLLNARYLNHFHNPMKSRSEWSDAGLNDYAFDIFHITGKSSVLWAQDGAHQAEFSEGDWSWRKVRDDYYRALTSGTEKERQAYFAKTFRGLVHQMHLVQDAAVPAHVRNDAHAEDALFKKNYEFGSYYFESWAKENSLTINSFASNPTFPKVPLSISQGVPALAPILQFTDTDRYRGGNPSTSLSVGLAEYTNANFFSDDTIFAAENYPTGHRHNFPYPKKSSTNVQEYLDGVLEPEIIYGEGNVPDITFYIEKVTDGEEIAHFVKPTYHTKNISDRPEPDFDVYYRTFYRDDVCHEDYASKLVPRAVGYSAALLDYFFRGEIEISLPTEQNLAGKYGITTDPEQGFTHIALKARNITGGGEEMTDGSIVLVVKYKLALEDPFQSYPVPTSEDFYYIVASETNNTREIPRESAVELEFDLSRAAIPVKATHVTIQVVYRGTLGAEQDSVAVGYKDISEPTPLDIFNNMDKVCLDGGWYDAGVEDTITLAESLSDANDIGIDVNPHHNYDIHLQISSAADPHYPSCTADDDIVIDRIDAGEFLRAAFILGDDEFALSSCDITSDIHSHPDDHNDFFRYIAGFMQTHPTIRNQSYLADPEFCLSQGGEPPCYLRHYPTLKSFRGVDMWDGFILTYDTEPTGSPPFSWESWGHSSNCSLTALEY